MRSALVALLALGMVVAACSQGGAGRTGAGAPDESYRTATLRDVVTGGDFSIKDLEGKVDVIETMAIWCSNCRMEQGRAQRALEQIGSADVAYLSLDVDPNEGPEDLADYVRREGFGWNFAVAPPEVSRALGATFGDQILSPPSTPLIVPEPDGQLIENYLP